MNLLQIESKFLLGNNIIKLSSLILSAILLIASVGKFLNGNDFRAFIELAFHIDGVFNLSIYIFVVTIEFFTSISLLLFSEKKWTYLLSSFLFLIFTCTILWGILEGIEDNCGCFGGIINDAGISWNSLVRNFLLLLLSAVIFCDIKEKKT